MQTFFAGLANVISQTNEHCRIPSCGKFSLGSVCVDCSRFVCLDHLYVKPSTKPHFVCASCIIDRHENLLDVDG